MPAGKDVAPASASADGVPGDVVPDEVDELDELDEVDESEAVAAGRTPPPRPKKLSVLLAVAVERDWLAATPLRARRIAPGKGLAAGAATSVGELAELDSLPTAVSPVRPLSS